MFSTHPIIFLVGLYIIWPFTVIWDVVNTYVLPFLKLVFEYTSKLGVKTNKTEMNEIR